MADLVNLGELTKPATVLIERISDAIGGIFRPWQIRRVAQAEAQAAEVRAAAQIDITELQHRALSRFLVEEANKQHNIESITSKALPEIEETARPEEIETDWITNFFDKCRLISDEEMQLLWSKVLAGEANSPGRFSKRTVDMLSSMDKRDAELFQRLCCFSWRYYGNDYVAFVFDIEQPIYQGKLTFTDLKNLESIGLISFDTAQHLFLTRQPEKIALS
ncbi:MAG TPA: DUF2806 domain-containing protein [Bryobacteraceae bacterium]|nr:DUF2806 domain-containing protein [Bryobacteraceae bacterium]